MPNLTIDDIEKQLYAAENAFSHFCSSLSDEQFFYQPEGKWSPAQQVKHLIVAANNTKLAFALPKFIVRWYAGKPNRPSRSYDELVDKYKLKLMQGGKASGRFIPKLHTVYCEWAGASFHRIACSIYQKMK